MLGADPPVLKVKIVQHGKKLPSLPKHFLTKLSYAREESLIMRLRSKTASTLFKYFSHKSQRRYHQIRAGAKRGPGGTWPSNQYACLPLMNKLTLLKTAAFGLNFNFGPP